MSASSRRPLVSILGDSISTFAGCNPAGFDVFYEGQRCEATGVTRREDTWWQLLVDAVGGELLANGSFSGSMVEGAGFPAASSGERISALSRDDKTPDIVVVFIGINDYGWGGAANQAAGRGRAVPDAALDCEPRIAQRAAADAAECFEDAYGAMLAGIRESYPEAQVWCCTLCPGRLLHSEAPTFIRRLRGVDFQLYNRSIRKQAESHGCKLIDFASFELDYEALDGTHPTARGMRQLAAMAARAMSEQGALDASVSDALFQEAFAGTQMQSRDICEKPDCLECSFARATGNTWSLVCEKELAHVG